jgi:hypothetical protein
VDLSAVCSLVSQKEKMRLRDEILAPRFRQDLKHFSMFSIVAIIAIASSLA